MWIDVCTGIGGKNFLLGQVRIEMNAVDEVDETQGVQVKLCYPLAMRAIPERLRDALCGDAIQIDYIYLYRQTNSFHV